MAVQDQSGYIRSLVSEQIRLVPYNTDWPRQFSVIAAELRRLPGELIGRIEHFGSTAVPGLSAKPVIDILAEVSNLEQAKSLLVPLLLSQGYEYLWRPAKGDDTPPWYAWFIGRDSRGKRNCHIHMVEPDSELWERLLFRDYLREFSDTALEYALLKKELAERYPSDREAYSAGKSAFIESVTHKAGKYYHRFL